MNKATYTLYIVSNATKHPFLSNVSYNMALAEAEYYNWHWIDENGFKWRMEIDED